MGVLGSRSARLACAISAAFAAFHGLAGTARAQATLRVPAGFPSIQQELRDGGASPELDRYRLRLGNGDDSGDQPLTRGGVRIRE